MTVDNCNRREDAWWSTSERSADLGEAQTKDEAEAAQKTTSETTDRQPDEARDNQHAGEHGLDAATGRKRLTARLREANIPLTARYVDVAEGEKRPIGRHKDAGNRFDADAPSLSGNYGLYATAADRLVILDVDDYNDLDDPSGLDAVHGLPETLTQRSAHGGSHRIYAVEPKDGASIADLLEAEFDAQNPQPSWGEVKTANQMVVAAGSRIDARGCNKGNPDANWREGTQFSVSEWPDWDNHDENEDTEAFLARTDFPCKECATCGSSYDFGPDGEGDRPIATINADDLLNVLRADPRLTSGNADETAASNDSVGNIGTRTEGTYSGFTDDDALLEQAKTAKNGEKFTDLWEGRWDSYYPSQSEADLALCGMLGYWTQYDESRMDRLFRDSGLMRPKWDESRGAQTYGEMTVTKATAGIGDGDTPDNTVAEQAREQADAAADPDATADLSWVERYDRELRAFDAADETPDKGYLRTALADWFRNDYDFLAVAEDGNPSDGTLYVYDTDEQVFTPRGENHVAGLLTNVASPTKRPGPNVEFTTHDVREVIGKIRNDATLQVEPEELNAGDRDGRYLPVANGVLNLDTRELHDHDPEWRFTVKAPVEYDPDAPHPEAFESLLDAMTAGDEIQKRTLKEWGGFCLTPGYDPEKFLLLHAPGQNGKGTYFYTFRKLLGDDLTSGVRLRQMTGDHFETSQLKGARANFDGETPGRKITTEQLDVIKGYSGGDYSYARDAYEKAEGSGFENTAKLAFAANEPPRFHEDADGIERRILPVRLGGKFTADPDDDHPMKRSRTEVRTELTDPTEQSGILNVLLDALEDMENRGKQFAIETRGTPKQRFAEYMAHADPIHGFADACLDADAGGSSAVTKDAVYNAYREMCDRNEKTSTNRSVFFRELGKHDGITWTEYRPGSGPDRPVVPYLRGLWFTDIGYQYVKPTDADDLLHIAKTHSRLAGSIADAEVLADIADRSRDRERGNDDGDEQVAAEHEHPAPESDNGDRLGVPEVPADATGPKADRDRLLRYLIEREDDGLPTPSAGELVRRMDERHGWRPNHTSDMLARLQTQGDVIRADGGFAANL